MVSRRSSLLIIRVVLILIVGAAMAQGLRTHIAGKPIAIDFDNILWRVKHPAMIGTGALGAALLTSVTNQPRLEKSMFAALLLLAAVGMYYLTMSQVAWLSGGSCRAFME
jgi:hypothetical protein